MIAPVIVVFHEARQGALEFPLAKVQIGNVRPASMRPRSFDRGNDYTRISDLAPLTARVYALTRRSATIPPAGRGGG